MIAIIFLTFLIIFIIKFIYQFRYDFDYVSLYLLTVIQGYKFKMARTDKEIKEALMLKDKGNVIEELLACPGWLPILSIESVNGPLWNELKVNFMKFTKELPSKSELGIIAHNEINSFILNNTKINSKDISKLTLKIFTTWIFKDTTFEHDQKLTGLTDEMLEKIYEGSIEYRKEIALKGRGCQKKKQETVDIMVELLKNNSKFKNLFADWSKPEHYSALMQPYIISPMINVSDIAVSIEKNQSLYEKYNKDINLFIDCCIQMSHPFPMLERYNAETNTQIFIDLTDMKESEKSFLFNYGYGPRACLGRLYAREFLSEFFKPILEADNIDFRPKENHVYSGRDNDNGHLHESFYQIKLIGGVFLDLVKKRMIQKNF
jgi:hypothetical protein